MVHDHGRDIGDDEDDAAAVADVVADAAADVDGSYGSGPATKAGEQASLSRAHR